MVSGIHYNASNFRPSPHVAFAACFAQFGVFVIKGAYLPNCCHTSAKDISHLTRRQTEQGVLVLTSKNLGRTSSASHNLGALANAKLNVVNRGASGYRIEGQRVPCADGCVRAGLHRVTDFQAIGRDDVSPVAVRIFYQGDSR
jgi:hypothetical protein